MTYFMDGEEESSSEETKPEEEKSEEKSEQFKTPNIMISGVCEETNRKG